MTPIAKPLQKYANSLAKPADLQIRVVELDVTKFIFEKCYHQACLNFDFYARLVDPRFSDSALPDLSSGSWTNKTASLHPDFPPANVLRLLEQTRIICCQDFLLRFRHRDSLYKSSFLLQEGLCDSKPGYVGRENENHVDLNRDFPDQFDPVKAGEFVFVIRVVINELGHNELPWNVGLSRSKWK